MKEITNRFKDKTNRHFSPTQNEISNLIIQNEGYTPEEIIIIANDRAEDQIEDPAAINYFNTAVSILNARLRLKLPTINSTSLQISYPSFRYEEIIPAPNYFLPITSSTDTNLTTSLSYDNNILLASYRPDILDGATPGFLKFKFVVKGGNSVLTPINYFQFDIKISFNKDGLLINSTAENVNQYFNLKKINLFNNQVKFKTFNNSGTFELFLIPPVLIGETMQTVSIQVEEIVKENVFLTIGDIKYVPSVTNYPLFVDKFNVKYPAVSTYNNIIPAAFIWNFPKEWTINLFIPILQSLIYTREGENNNLFYMEKQSTEVHSHFEKWERGKMPYALVKHFKTKTNKSNSTLFY